jgi:hypothetical protein
MELTKIQHLVATAKKAVFYPDRGAAMSGVYAWKFSDKEIVFLHYNARTDELLDFRLVPIAQFERLNFPFLMQKHITSANKLPDALVDRVQQLHSNWIENMRLVQEEGLLFGIGDKEFVIYDDFTDLQVLVFLKQWSVSPYYESFRLGILRKLWQNPGIHTRKIRPDAAQFWRSYLEKLRANLAKIESGKYAVFYPNQLILSFQQHYLLAPLNPSHEFEDFFLLNPLAHIITQKEVISYLNELQRNQSYSTELGDFRAIPEVFSKEKKRLSEALSQSKNKILDNYIQYIQQGNTLITENKHNEKRRIEYTDNEFWLVGFTLQTDNLLTEQRERSSEIEVRNFLAQSPALGWQYLVYFSM